jgi:hypothetical protein
MYTIHVDLIRQFINKIKLIAVPDINGIGFSIAMRRLIICCFFKFLPSAETFSDKERREFQQYIKTDT